ncbi:hypothetical protein ACB092_05G169300 [Castanea dentata]
MILLIMQVYVDFFSIAILLLGGALACYGLLLCLKMSKVRYERASYEMWKVSGLAVVSVLCFSSSSFVALLTDIPMLYHWPQHPIKVVYTSLLLILYYFKDIKSESNIIVFLDANGCSLSAKLGKKVWNL